MAMRCESLTAPSNRPGLTEITHRRGFRVERLAPSRWR
jgi:hypothetical protein